MRTSEIFLPASGEKLLSNGKSTGNRACAFFILLLFSARPYAKRRLALGISLYFI